MGSIALVAGVTYSTSSSDGSNWITRIYYSTHSFSWPLDIVLYPPAFASGILIGGVGGVISMIYRLDMSLSKASISLGSHDEYPAFDTTKARAGKEPTGDRVVLPSLGKVIKQRLSRGGPFPVFSFSATAILLALCAGLPPILSASLPATPNHVDVSHGFTGCL